MAQKQLSEELYANVANWEQYPEFSDAERVALEFTEKFALDHHALDARFFERMKKHWNDEQILEISVCVGTWLSMGRIVRVMGAEVSCPIGIQVE